MTPTAPRPIPRMQHEFCFQRIRGHVMQLLRNLCRGINIQIKVPPLPKSPQPLAVRRKCQRHLSSRRTLLATYASRNSLLEHLQDRRWFDGARFADQQMYMLGHNHIADQRAPIPRAHLTQGLHRHISRTHAAQQSPSLIAAKCDEMQMAKPGDASQTFRHSGRSERPTLCKNRKG